MNELTPLERSVLQFIQSSWKRDGNPPSLQQIAAHFSFETESAARRHVSLLQEKGYLVIDPAANANPRLWTPWFSSARSTDIPVLGSIPCGATEEKVQEIKGYLPIELEKLGIPASPCLFAVEACGDSMVGRQIAPGDYVILDKDRVPRSGDVVAALIGSECTLKTFVVERNKAFLRAENPKYKNIFPAEETVVQGVMVLLVRKAI